MQIQNLQIYSSSIAVSAKGPWIDVSNLVSLSVQVNGYNSGVGNGADIEVSNDPNVMIDGTGIGAPGSAPVLSQIAGGLTFQSGVSNLPALTYYVKVTYITKWGETTASAEANLAVTAGNALIVAVPAPSATQVPFVTGWNVYAALSTGAEVLQTAPPYSPQRLIDGIGTVGGTTSGTGGIHWATTGALPIAQPSYTLINGFQNTGFLPPGSDQSGGTNFGVSVSSGAGLSTLTPDTNTTVAVFIDSSNHNLMWTPSCMTWKFLRVINGGASTVAYLNGQRG
jgi:hypothetical protein